jgi:glutamyl-queuosine tRNA(Asp) synthetase
VPRIGRFAPSPTGALHLGNLRTALASWLSVKSRGGRWLVRIEDVDRSRCRAELGEAQIRDLAALGLESDGPIEWQSRRENLYRAALARLHDAQALYPCVCTRKDLASLARAPHAEDGLRPYPGRCRERPWEGFDRALRVRLPEAGVAWNDLAQGPQQDVPARLTGDPLLFRRDGLFAYHLAVVVDDGGQGVSEVVRGDDLRSVTATQIRLQEALGLPRPEYGHLGLVTAPDGSRLGKRDRAVGLRELRARGVAVPEILGWLGFSLGCLDRPGPCEAKDLVPGFDWGRVPRGEVPVPQRFQS